MTTNTVIDLSHHNGHPDFAKIKADGIVGVVHKATQGFNRTDPMYVTNRMKALDNGLLWGAYHFGVNADGGGQADFFLDVVKPTAQTLIVLDYEPNSGAHNTMSLMQAQRFVERVHLKTGRWPGLYSGHLIKEKLGNLSQPHPVFSQCFLWIAQYATQPTRIPKTWPTWTLWQYTDGSFGPQPHRVEGVGFCDRDQFNGDSAGLRRLWGVAEDK
jgi:lysozyme